MLLESGNESELLKEAYGSEDEEDDLEAFDADEEEEQAEEDPDATPATQLTETVISEEDEGSVRDSSVERFYAEYEDELEEESENFAVDDEATAEELQDSKSQPSMYLEDREYVAWLRKWGRVDFEELQFLPYLWSNE